MMQHTEYDFVSVNRTFIHNRGPGFSGTTKWPSFEDAAYMREIVRTLECWNSYRMWNHYDEYLVGVGTKDTVPMMPSICRWQDDLEYIQTICSADTWDWAGDDGVVIKSSHMTFADTVGSPTLQFEDIRSSLYNLGHQSIETTGTMIPTRRVYDEFRKGAYQFCPYSPYAHRGFLHTYCGRDTPYLYQSQAGMNEPFYPSSERWYQDGDPAPAWQDPPGGFLVASGDPNITPVMYYRDYRSDYDDTWSKEGSWSYTFAPPPWTHGRVVSSEIDFVPIFRIRLLPTWKIKHTDSAYPSTGYPDKKYYDVIWTRGTGLFKMGYIPADGGTVKVQIHGGDWTIKQLCDYVVTSSGVPNWAVTEPRERDLTPNVEWALPDGFEVYVDLAGVFMRRYLRRNISAFS